MGGDIGIVDKDIGAKGTCFRFNIFLTTCDTVPSDHGKEEDIEAQGHATSSYSYQPLDLRIQSTCNPGLNILTSPRPSPRAEGSHVIILMQSDERRRITQRLFETLGIKVSVLKEWERFLYALKKIRRKVSLSHRSSSGISEFSPRSFRSGSFSSNAGPKDMPLSAMDGTDLTLPTPRKTYARGTPRFILILIEATAGPFPELCRAVAEFRKDLQNTCCRAVWLDKPTLRSVNFRDVPEEMISPNDLVMLKPFHGSRLYQVAKLLPEFGGPMLGISAISQVGKAGPELSLSSLPTTNRTTPRKSRSRVRLVKEPEIQEVGTSSNQNPLRGKRVLIAEDSMVLCKLATAHVTRLGGTVEACDNGAKAVELVCNGLRNNMKNNASIILPYDYILMDCEVQFTLPVSFTYHKFDF